MTLFDSHKLEADVNYIFYARCLRIETYHEKRERNQHPFLKKNLIRRVKDDKTAPELSKITLDTCINIL